MYRFKSLENYRDKDLVESTYELNLNQALNEIMEDLMEDDELMSIIGNENNSMMTVFDFFKEKLQEVVEETIDPYDTRNGFVLYNVLTDDNKFYSAWSKEMFMKMMEPFKIIRNSIYG